jgi:hypothetical protein
MRLFKTLKNGAINVALSYKLILLIWITTLVFTLAAAFPLRAFLNMIFGNSMAMERLNDGFNIGLAGDLGKSFGALMASVSAGSFLIGAAGFLLMTFFAGGLFRRFTMAWGGLRISDFLRASANNFIPFLKLALLLILIFGGYTFVIVGLPGLIAMGLSGGKTPPSAVIWSIWAAWALGMPVLLFVADASRRWIAATGSGHALKAVGAGFRALKGRFWNSYLTLLTVLVINAILAAALFWYAAYATPDKGFAVFLFFITTQMLFILRLFMKAWRYAVVCEAVQ